MADSEERSESLEGRFISLAPLLKILECPVCLDVVKIPFATCQRGHLACKECMISLPNCPTCKATFSWECPVSVKSLLEALPRTCRYSGNGCKNIVEPSDLDANGCHEEYCSFRPVVCRFPMCQQEVVARQVKDHYITHSPLKVFTSPSSPIRWKNFKWTPGYYDVPIFFDDTVFWLRMLKNTNNDQLELWFEAVFIRKPVDDLFICIKFEKHHIGSTITLKASLENEGNEASHGKVLYSQIACCINDANLTFKYDIFTKPK